MFIMVKMWYSADESVKRDFQMKATTQYFPVELFTVMLYDVVC